MIVLEGFHLAVLAVLGALVAQVCMNRRALVRLDPRGEEPERRPRISVLIPARDEAAKIGVCVESWVAQDYPDFEVLVYDDDSADDTAAIAAAAGGARVHVVRGGGLPSGWRGKPWSCHSLRARARGELLVFADADVAVEPGALAATVSALARSRADLLSALPRHVAPRGLLRVLAGIQNWAVLSFIPLWLSGTSRGRTFAAVNGQYIAVPVAVYDACGGFAAVRGSVAEDVDLGRLLAARGLQALLVDGSKVMRCESYGTLREAWKGNVRNLVPIFFGSAALLLAATSAAAAVYLAPIGMLAADALFRVPRLLFLWLPLTELALAVLGRWLVDARFGVSGASSLLHPVAMAGLCAMSVGSIVEHRMRGAVDWRGRRYPVGTGGD
ncbi:MAG TPA: glycosyltransferase [Gammaproteobacteria bacterium]|nr:glycosyltransferase [Gammaproteobacteria bacterium]